MAPIELYRSITLKEKKTRVEVMHLDELIQNKHLFTETVGHTKTRKNEFTVAIFPFDCLLPFPLMTTGQLADHYCHWFTELSFSRISESNTRGFSSL